MEHLHCCCCCCVLIELSIFFFFCCGCFDLSSTYNHNKIKGIPNTKNMLIVRTGIRKTNRNIPKHNVAIPRAESQRLVRLSIYTNQHLSNIRHFFFLFLLFSLFIFCKDFSYYTTII
jgi:hypothetical protein